MKTDFILFLKKELHRRIESNPNYSLRAFAKKLGISSGTLCDIFQNKRPLTLKNFEKIIGYFDLDEQQVERFKNWVKNNCEQKATFSELDKKQGEIFQTPQYAALIELLNLEPFQNNLEKLSVALNISKETCHNYLEQLVDAEILSKDNQKYIINDKNYAGNNAFPISFFKNIIENAYEKIDLLDPSEHMSLGAAYAINKEDLPKIKQEIIDLHAKLTYWNGKRTDKDSVYFLNINFTPY